MPYTKSAAVTAATADIKLVRNASEPIGIS